MIYLYQNNKEYDYDVRAIALAFFERTKIMEVSEDQLDETGDVLRLRLVYGQESIEGCLYDGEGRRVKKTYIVITAIMNIAGMKSVVFSTVCLPNIQEEPCPGGCLPGYVRPRLS